MRDKNIFCPSSGKEDPTPAPKGFKERMYDKVKLPLWAIDTLITVLVIALITVVIIGTR